MAGELELITEILLDWYWLIVMVVSLLIFFKVIYPKIIEFLDGRDEGDHQPTYKEAYKKYETTPEEDDPVNALIEKYKKKENKGHEYY